MSVFFSSAGRQGEDIHAHGCDGSSDGGSSSGLCCRDHLHRTPSGLKTKL